MELLFTKGIKGKINKGNIVLMSGNKVIETDYTCSDQDIIKLEREYNVRLLGDIIRENGLIKRDSDFNFRVSKNNYMIIDISSLFYKLDAEFVDICELIEQKLFPNTEEYYSCICKITPIFITTEGLEPNFFYKKQEFQNALTTSALWEVFDVETQNKLIYMYDLLSMISDIKNYVFNLHYNLVEAAKELCIFSAGVEKEFSLTNNDEQYEYKFTGYHSQVICSMYMNVIIELCSCLDIIAKLFCEITNFPDKFDKPYKFKNGNIYFSNIKRFQGKFENYKGYTDSILERCNDYKDLLLSRHLIVHNSFFSSSRVMFYGFGTHVVNYKKINYTLMYIWDVDKEGRPERWLNRCKFYGQNRTIDDYIIGYLVKFYEELGNTLKVIKNYFYN